VLLPVCNLASVAFGPERSLSSANWQRIVKAEDEYQSGEGIRVLNLVD